jgi:hypothetical protein
VIVPWVVLLGVCEGNLVWEQLPDGVTAIQSQEDICYPFTTEVVDDFVGWSGYGTKDWIIGVTWWGAFLDGPPVEIESVNVRIYAGSFGYPYDLLYATKSEVHEIAGDPTGYCADIEPFSDAEDIRFFISIQMSFCGPTRWGWASGVGNGHEGFYRDDASPQWTPLSAVSGGQAREVAFQLRADLYSPDYVTCCFADGSCREVLETVCNQAGGVVNDCVACEPTPVRRTTFGRIKDLYQPRDAN